MPKSKLNLEQSKVSRFWRAKQEVVLISACLIGINCSWDGKNKLNKKCLKLFKEGKFISVCPEQLGGLPTPRSPQEIQEGTGERVLNGKCKVKNKDGKDLTKNFIKGARGTLKIAKLVGAKEAIFKSKSPSWGCGTTYDGSFSGRLIPGDGVTTALLKRNGIRVITEKDI